MKKLISILMALTMLCSLLPVAANAAVYTKYPLSVYSVSQEASVLTVSGNKISVKDLDAAKGITAICNSVVFNANASIHDGFIIRISDIAWDTAYGNGIMIYVSPDQNGRMPNGSAEGVALYVNKSGNVYMWSSVKNGYNPDTHGFGKWTDMYAAQADVLADKADSFYYAILPLGGYSEYGVFVTDHEPVAAGDGADTPLYKFNTTATQLYDGNWVTGVPGEGNYHDTLFLDAGNDAKNFNFSFQVFADGALSWGDGITTVPSGGSLSYTVESITFPGQAKKTDYFGYTGSDLFDATGTAIDGGYYNDASYALAFTAKFKSFENLNYNYLIDRDQSKNFEYGLYVYSEGNAANTEKHIYTDTPDALNEYFYTVIDIAEANKATNVYVIPYAVVDGKTIVGGTMSAKASDFSANCLGEAPAN